MISPLHTRLNRLAAPFAIGLAIGVAAPSLSLAQSVSDDGPRRQTVSYADLDLSKEAGMNAVATRIHAAALNVCATDAPPTPLSARMAYDKCMHVAVQNAMSAVQRTLTLARTAASPGPVTIAAASTR